jgi:hypothetical protein
MRSAVSVTESASWPKAAIHANSLAIRRFRWQKHVIRARRRATSPQEVLLI